MIKRFTECDLHLLNKQELLLWNNQKRHFRNGEDWVVGRVTAKYAIGKCLDINADDIIQIEIHNDKNGVPYSSGGKQNNIAFSISHCDSIGFSCSSRGVPGIGCDIEKIRSRHPNFAKYYLLEREKESWFKSLSHEDKDTILTVAWACKEASYKSLSKKINQPENIENIKVFPSSKGKEFYYYAECVHGVGYWEKCGRYVLCVALIGEN
ncbi:4'-phosphopantetheinyl transferase family protein [Halobacillus salinus]|uniref:4'-phosphopantetheinyl transferase family protein n=1 Tax=Halobacillus salinus TaxID=192814 RepID=UPI0013051ED2|nr:4'-phosphopantetheinyl transferase superfamily protein [Halobacillus salinus]